MLRALPAALAVVLSVAVPAVARAQAGGAAMQCHDLRTLQDPSSIIHEAVEGAPGAFHSRLLKDAASGAPAEIDCDDTKVFADVIEWRTDQDVVHLAGHVVFEQPGLRIYADHAEVNRVTRLGTFYDVSGSAEITKEKVEKSLFGGLEPDVYFFGAKIEKTGDRTYELTDGGFSTCVQPTPRWEMTGSHGTITLDKHVVLRNAVLKVKDVPLFYVPLIYYPINHEGRSTGFLMPSFGSSTVRGFTLSNAFFWAIDRSQDATFFHDYFSQSGQGVGGQYRFISAPGSQGETDVYMLDERTRYGTDGTTIERPGHRSWTVRGNANQVLPHGFRLMGNVNYFTDATTQQLYQQNLYDLSQRTRTIYATLSGGFGRLRLTAAFNQNDVYYNLTTAQRRGYAPKIDLSLTNRPIGGSRVTFGVNGEAAYLVREDNLNDPATNHNLWRFDASPTIRAPLGGLSFLQVTTSATWRITEWLESQDPLSPDPQNPVQIHHPLTRQLLDLQAQIVGPGFSRVFQTPSSGYATRFKHLIEPNLTIDWISPFHNFNEVVKVDSVDTLVGGTTRIAYGITNHLLARRKTGSGPGVVREILTVDLSQTYYSNARATQYDPQYESNLSAASATTSPFTPLQLTVVARPLDRLSGQFRMEYDTKYHAVRTYGASGTLTGGDLQVSMGWSKQQVIPGLQGFDDPASAYHFLNASTTLRRSDGHLGGTYALNWDIHHQTLLQQRIVAFYNSQCCGVSVDYQAVNVANLGLSTIPTDRRFGISFTLAGLGSFSNPLGSFLR
jgi:LPS-assembly protein